MSRTTHQIHLREHRFDMLQSVAKRSPQLQSIPHLNRARDPTYDHQLENRVSWRWI